MPDFQGDEMGTVEIRYDTLALSQQVLERQRTHAGAIQQYLPGNADIADSTGFLLAAFRPLSQAAVAVAVEAARTLEQIELAAAAAVGDTARDFADSDGKVGESFSKLIGRLGVSGQDGSYPDLAGPTLGAAGEGAEADYGDVDSWVWEKAGSAAETLAGAPHDVQQLIDQLGQLGTPRRVSELVDASSYLVPPQAPENPVQDLRWSAGVLLGGIDWVAEKFIGFSILDRCVFHPLAGDWQGIYRGSEAWKHCADAASAIGRNHVGLVASTPTGWQGLSGNSFRGAMSTVAGGALGLGAAYDYAGGLVKTLSTVCKLACTGIGMALKFIADKLLKMAAEAATPVVGWAVGAVTAYSDIQGVISKVRLVYTIIETISSAIADFAEAKVSILDKLALLEDLLSGLGKSAAPA
jgi:hypothetical protein